MRRCLLLAVALLTLGPASARAAQISIDFDFTSSTISAIGGAVNIPPDGAILSAFARVKVPGAGIVTPSGGPITLSALTLSATIDATILLNTITGFVIASQLNTAMGLLTGNLTNAVILPPIFLDTSLSVNCAGFLCGVVGQFPITLNGTQTINDSFTLMVSGLDVSGSAMVSGTFSFDFNGTTAMVMLVGTEITRTFLPEPGLLMQLGVGLAGLGFLGWRVRKKR